MASIRDLGVGAGAEQELNQPKDIPDPPAVEPEYSAPAPAPEPANAGPTNSLVESNGQELITWISENVGFGDSEVAFPVVGQGPQDLPYNNFGDPRPDDRTHKGLDIMAGFGVGVVSAMAGTVTYFGRQTEDTGSVGYGIVIKIEDGAGNTHKYAHLDPKTLREFDFQVGDRVAAGDPIGFVGNTGAAYKEGAGAPHLHYAINEGDDTRLIDPWELLVDGTYGESLIWGGTTEDGDLSDQAEQAGDGKLRKTYTMDQMSPEVREEIERDFPGWLDFINHPEIGLLLMEAVDIGWEPELFRSMLEGTEWHRENSEFRRKWMIKKSGDPAQASQDLRDTSLLIRKSAQYHGVAMTDTQIATLAEEIMTNGWKQGEQLNGNAVSAIIAYGRVNDAETGVIDVNQDDIMQIARSQHSMINEREAFDMAQRIANGTLSKETVEKQFRDDAIANNPFWETSLQKGLTMNDLFNSRKNRIAGLLQIDPEEVDYFKDSRWSKTMNGMDGQPMTFAELDDYVREQPEWERTDQAREQAAEWSERISKMFGAIA